MAEPVTSQWLADAIRLMRQAVCAHPQYAGAFTGPVLADEIEFRMRAMTAAETVAPSAEAALLLSVAPKGS